MKLSIIVVSYNEKEYLPEAIASCLNQEFDGTFEIIIGDDGSSDGSIELIREYAERYPGKIKYFIMDRENVQDVVPSFRVSNVLKRGLEIAQGEYIVCLSGDDVFCDVKKFEKQVSFLEQHGEYQSCYSGYKKFWNDGTEVLMHACEYRSNAVFWSGAYMHLSCFVFRRNLATNLLDRFCDDTGMFFSGFKMGKTYCMPAVMFAYRQRDGSIMKEADFLELNILELLLYQDVSNAGGYYWSSLSRFADPLLYVYEHKNELDNAKYEKYFAAGRNYPNDYLGQFKNFSACSTFEKTRILMKIKLAKASKKLFYHIRRRDERKG